MLPARGRAGPDLGSRFGAARRCRTWRRIPLSGECSYNRINGVYAAENTWLLRFDYSELPVDDDLAMLRVVVTNTGDRAGREVIQAYASLPGSEVSRPVRWLIGFASATLAPGERWVVEIPFRRTDLAYRNGRWVVEGGDYRVSVGASSRDLRLEASVHVTGDAVTAPFTGESTLGELLAAINSQRS